MGTEGRGGREREGRRKAGIEQEGEEKGTKENEGEEIRERRNSFFRAKLSSFLMLLLSRLSRILSFVSRR